MIRLSALNLYPVKSARGTSVERWPVDSFGLARDRRYMVVDAEGRFITQRKHPHIQVLPQIKIRTMWEYLHRKHPRIQTLFQIKIQTGNGLLLKKEIARIL